ncbi:MAG TPA: TIR domain-containing protein [Sphingomicrobium sp.]|nr:TIR domain-containing protein [Sphingomicrobium sp.]
MSGTDIFLSYARTDRPAARLFAESLAAEEFKVWWDASLHSGETFDEVIEQKLRDAKAVVVLWSPRSVASRWVRAEATLADRRNKLVPAIIEACDRPIAFELTHTTELADWEGDRSDLRWRSFVEDLKRLTHANLEEQPDFAQAPANQAKVPGTPQPVARPPLRPGSDQVIAAEQHRNEQPVRTPAEEPAGPSEVHCLEIKDGEMADELFAVETSGMKIGRAPPADIVLSHKSVSREHCIVGLANDELLVTDLNSTNGTYIDDVRIHRATILPVGSVLRLGQVSLRHSIMTKSNAGQRERALFQPARAAASS